MGFSFPKENPKSKKIPVQMSTGIYIEKKDIAEQELNNYKRLHELRYTVVFSYACYANRRSLTK